jgi:LPS-assembly protein
MNSVFKLHFSAFFLSIAVLSPTLAFSAEKSPETEAVVPVQVHGDSVEYFHEQQKVVGIGNVSIDYEGSTLTADKITVYTGTNIAVAEGHVTLKQPGGTFKGEHAEYNYKTKIGDVTGMSGQFDESLYGKAKRVQRVSENHYRATDSYVTTCCSDHPFYRIQAKTIDVYPGEKVVVHNALLVVKGIPILFIPVYVQRFLDFDRFPVQLVPGKSSEWGPFLLSRWRYELANGPELTSKGNVLLDYRLKKGAAGGVENFYRGDKMGRGAARVYYANDQEPDEAITQDRFRVQWRHQAELTQDTTFTAEFNKMSDPLLVKDFFYQEEYEQNAQPDSYVSIITAKPEYTVSFLDRERINDFSTVVERSPEIRFDTHNRQFVETPFYLRQEVQFTNLKKEYANSKEQMDATRLDTNHTLSYAGRVGAVSVTPRIGTRQTYYSRGIEQEDMVRSTVDPGLDVSTRFYKTYDTYVKAFGLDYNQIRHIFTPTASYNFRPTPTAPRTVLQPFDELDSLDKQNYIRFQFENKLQTKNHDKANQLYTREIARLIPFVDYNFQNGRLDNVGFDVELRPYSWLGIEADAAYDTRTGDVTTMNTDLYFTKGDVTFGIGHRYLQEDSALTTTELRWRINQDLAVKVYERFEFEDGESEEFEATISRTFECVIVDFTYNHRDGDTFYFAFRLKGYPAAGFSLSQSYNRPKSPAASARI